MNALDDRMERIDIILYITEILIAVNPQSSLIDISLTRLLIGSII